MSNGEHANVTVCSCGAVYTLDAWDALPLVGVQRIPGEGSLELRNCTCRSTCAVPVATLDLARAQRAATYLNADVAVEAEEN